MTDWRPLVGIDVGSSAVSVVVAALEDDTLVVHGCGHARHDGARKGVIANLEQVSDAVRTAAEEAEAMASLPVEEVVVGIGGIPIAGYPSRASVPVTGRDHTVTSGDIRRALSACSQMDVPADYRVLDIIAGAFAVDGHSGLEHPVGMPGRRLDAEAYVLFTHATHADTVVQAVNRASLSVRRLVYEPLAGSAAVLSRDERELGCLLLDVGYATTEWVLHVDGVVIATGAVPIGGRHFTADLATFLKTTTAAAEQIKRRSTATLTREGLEVTAVEVPTLGGDGHHVHSAAVVAEVLHERARDLLVSVHQMLVKAQLDRVPRAGIVLTGGGALLDGLEEEAERVFGHRARLGIPRGLAGLVEPISGPEWAVACGLVRVLGDPERTFLTTNRARGGLFERLRDTLNELFVFGGGS